jgi:hypothetical protein
VRPGLWLHVGVFPPGQAVGQRHRAVVASHRERVQHRCRIEAELSVKGEVHVLPDRPSAVLVKRLEDHLQQAQLVLRQLLTQHPVHASDTNESASPENEIVAFPACRAVTVVSGTTGPAGAHTGFRQSGYLSRIPARVAFLAPRRCCGTRRTSPDPVQYNADRRPPVVRDIPARALAVTVAGPTWARQVLAPNRTLAILSRPSTERAHCHGELAAERALG